MVDFQYQMWVEFITTLLLTNTERSKYPSCGVLKQVGGRKSKEWTISSGSFLISLEATLSP